MLVAKSLRFARSTVTDMVYGRTPISASMAFSRGALPGGADRRSARRTVHAALDLPLLQAADAGVGATAGCDRVSAVASPKRRTCSPGALTAGRVPALR
jgi:hypothetical protein